MIKACQRLVSSDSIEDITKTLDKFKPYGTTHGKMVQYNDLVFRLLHLQDRGLGAELAKRELVADTYLSTVDADAVKYYAQKLHRFPSNRPFLWFVEFEVKAQQLAQKIRRTRIVPGGEQPAIITEATALTTQNPGLNFTNEYKTISFFRAFLLWQRTKQNSKDVSEFASQIGAATGYWPWDVKKYRKDDFEAEEVKPFFSNPSDIEEVMKTLTFDGDVPHYTNIGSLSTQLAMPSFVIGR